MIIFDIETAPLPSEELDRLMPPFEPTEVKVGNMVDKQKINEKINNARTKHRQDFYDNAALDPLTGRVLCIGIIDMEYAKESYFYNEDEAMVLDNFWNRISGSEIVGFNIHSFDLPFLYRRSWKHRIQPPSFYRVAKWWDNTIDLRDVWQLGDRMVHGSLDSIARHLGVGQKTGNGADFHKLWESDRPAALEYLKNDLMLTKAIAQVFGVI